MNPLRALRTPTALVYAPGGGECGFAPPFLRQAQPPVRATGEHDQNKVATITLWAPSLPVDARYLGALLPWERAHLPRCGNHYKGLFSEGCSRTPVRSAVHARRSCLPPFASQVAIIWSDTAGAPPWNRPGYGGVMGERRRPPEPVPYERPSQAGAAREPRSP